MDEEELKKLVTAIGSMAEMSSIFYRSLISSGVNEDTATAMACAFVETIVGRALPPRKNNAT